MKKTIKELFQDCKGKISSKRVGGYIIISVLIFSYLADQAFGLKLNQSAFHALALVAGGLVGAGIFEKSEDSR